jgi:hypothetical protein
MKGDVVVEFRCGVKVLASPERWGYGQVFRVYQVKFFIDGKYEWARDDRLFTREDAIEEASRRVQFAEACGDYINWRKDYNVTQKFK